MEMYKFICLCCKEKLQGINHSRWNIKQHIRQTNKYKWLTTRKHIQNTINIFNKRKTRQLMGVRDNFQTHTTYTLHILPSWTSRHKLNLKKLNQHDNTIIQNTITTTHTRRQYRAKMCILHIHDTHIAWERWVVVIHTIRIFNQMKC
jgi:hypothetical protein